MEATNQFSTIYVQNWRLMRFVAFMVDITKCPPSTYPHLNTNNTVKQKDVFMDYIIISIGLKICCVAMTWMTV